MQQGARDTERKKIEKIKMRMTKEGTVLNEEIRKRRTQVYEKRNVKPV
jgi:hypothetical protein